MDATFGIVGKDFVLLAADLKVVRSILVYKDDEEKVSALSRTSESLWRRQNAPLKTRLIMRTGIGSIDWILIRHWRSTRTK